MESIATAPKVHLKPIAWLGVMAFFSLPLFALPGYKTEPGEWAAYILTGLALAFLLGFRRALVPVFSAKALEVLGIIYLGRVVVFALYGRQQLGVGHWLTYPAFWVFILFWVWRGQTLFDRLLQTKSIPKLPKFSPTAAYWYVGTALLSLSAYWTCCLHVDDVPMAVHHLAFYLGPIDLIKQGHLLLYDVPSQYGFLGILLPALLPWTAFQSFFVVYGAIRLVCVLLIYAILSRAMPSRWGFAVAALGAFVCVFLFPGYFIVDPIIGSPFTPSNGALRFFWAFALAATLALSNSDTRRFRVLLALIFTIGALWSVESFAYSLCVVFFTCLGELLGEQRLTKSFRLWRLSFAFLLAAFVMANLFYLARWAIWPDWYAYVEYARAYSGGFGALPVQPQSVIWLFVLFFGFIVKEAARTGRAGWAVAGFCFGTMTYFISRSGDINLWYISCFWFPLLFLLARRNPVSYHPAVRIACILIVFLSTHFKMPYFLARATSFGEDLGAVLEKTALVSGATTPWTLQPVVDMTGEYLPLTVFGEYKFKPWLPAYPKFELQVLAPERQQIYIQRFLRRTPVSEGYMILNPADPWSVWVVESLIQQGWKAGLISKNGDLQALVFKRQ